MAKSYGNAGIPLDTPILLRPGVMHREADCHGNAKWYVQPWESSTEAAKGNLGNTVIPGLESKPLSHPGLPFMNLRNGRGK